MKGDWAYPDLEHRALAPEEIQNRARFKKNMKTLNKTGLISLIACATICTCVNIFLPFYISLKNITHSTILMNTFPPNAHILQTYLNSSYSHEPYFDGEMAAYLLANDITVIIFSIWILLMTGMALVRPTHVWHKVSTLKFFSAAIFFIIISIWYFTNYPDFSGGTFTPSHPLPPTLSALKEEWLLALAGLGLGAISVAAINRVREIRAGEQ